VQSDLNPTTAEQALRDSERTMRERMQIETVIADLSAGLVNAPSAEVEAAIASGFDRAIALLDVDQVAFSAFSDDRRALRVLQGRRRSQGVFPPTSASRDEMPWYFGRLAGGEPVVVPDPVEFPADAFAERRAAEASSLSSHVAIPLTIGQDGLGVFSLSTFSAGRRSWPPEVVPRLRLIGEIVASGLARKRAERERQRLLEQLERDAETKSRLLKEVNHRVKNNLASVLGLFYTERSRIRSLKQVSPLELVEAMISRVRSLATVHNLLSATEWKPVRITDLARSIASATVQLLPADERVIVDVASAEVWVDAAQANTLALVLNELVTNSIKHAVAPGGLARVRVGIEPAGNCAVIEFRDNGPGYPDAVTTEEGGNVGLDLVRELVLDGLHGELSLRNDGGAVATIRFEAT